MFQTLDEIEQMIAGAMVRDRFQLSKLLRGVRKARQEGRNHDRDSQRLLERLKRSIALRDRRAAARPELRYDGELPVVERREDIAAAISEHQTVIVCGETGSGKSTQLPKICLELGRGVEGVIGHTQPRRIAARSIASRVAEELGVRVGEGVGFKIRFSDSTDPERTLVKMMTDGMLLAETQHDRYLEQYDTIILDEAHERSLNIDFLMGFLRRLLPRRPELKLIITSATIDADRFAEHFAEGDRPAPIIRVEGRAFPVDVEYRPLEPDANDPTPDLYSAVADACEEAARGDRGDILVFLATERDIREAHKVLRGRRFAGEGARSTEILPLYSRLSTQQQNRIFQAHAHRRIVLATNVAESSITVPGIRFVVDTGLARISRYSSRSKVQRLPIEAVSQASADQRKGRCGRVGPGVCFRLYAEEDYAERDRYTAPEIRRTNLAAVILQTLSLNLGAIEEFPFLDPPRTERIRDGYKTLFELGAIDHDYRLTDIGRQLSRLPVDPRIGRIVLAAREEHCLHEALIIASALEVQDPRDRPAEKQSAADEQHEKFSDQRSDFLAFLKLWDFYHDLRQRLSHNQLRKACQQNFLSYNRMREWVEVFRQLRQLAEGLGGGRLGKRRDDYDAIHRALLPGLLSNLAYRAEGNEYTGAGGGKFYLWPGSGLFEKKPTWVVAGELVETSRRYLRTAARVEPQWVEPMAEHLTKRSYSDPHWRSKQGAAMTYEKVTLFGLPIVLRRRVALAPIDPEQARRLLIHEGLSAGDIRTHAKFFRHNQKLLDEIAQLGDKTRKRDFVVDQWTQNQFYEQRVPAEIVDLGTLHRWLKQPGNEQRLMMSHNDLLEVSGGLDETGFPDRLNLKVVDLDLCYRFQPGEQDDGVTVVAPQQALGRLSERRLGWLVPGLLEEKVLALIRTLPKSLRRNFVPAPKVAGEIARSLPFGNGELLVQLAEALTRHCGERVSPSDFDVDRLPPHLHLNIRVLDDDGQPIGESRDLRELQQRFQVESEKLLEHDIVERSDDDQWSRDGLTKWDFGELPEEVRLRRGGVDLPFYPALVDRGETAAVTLLDSKAEAVQKTRGGLRRLFCLAEHKELRRQVQWIPDLDKILLHSSTLINAQALKKALGELIADRALHGQPGLPRDKESFEARRRFARGEIGPATQDVVKLIKPLFDCYHQARLAWESARTPQWRAIADDVQQQLDRLTANGFLLDTPWEWLCHLPRYFQAITARLKKLPGGSIARDQCGQAEVDPRQQRLQDLIDDQGRPQSPDELLYRWMLEEFRVSLFAQELGTSQTVSAKRLDKLWAKIQSQSR